MNKGIDGFDHPGLFKLAFYRPPAPVAAKASVPAEGADPSASESAAESEGMPPKREPQDGQVTAPN